MPDICFQVRDSHLGALEQTGALPSDAGIKVGLSRTSAGATTHDRQASRVNSGLELHAGVLGWARFAYRMLLLRMVEGYEGAPVPPFLAVTVPAAVACPSLCTLTATFIGGRQQTCGPVLRWGVRLWGLGSQSRSSQAQCVRWAVHCLLVSRRRLRMPRATSRGTAPQCAMDPWNRWEWERWDV